MQWFPRLTGRFFGLQVRGWIGTVTIILVLALLIVIYHWIAPKFPSPRPVFSDEFSTYRVLGMYQWSPPSYLFDKFENLAYSDKYLNVVLLMGGNSDVRRYHSRPVQSGVESEILLFSNCGTIDMRFGVEPDSCYMFAEGTTLITCKLKPDAVSQIRDEESRLNRENDWPMPSLPDFIEPLCILDSKDGQNARRGLELMRNPGDDIPGEIPGQPY